MYDYAWLQYDRITKSMLEGSVTGANHCIGAYLIVLVVRHLLTVKSTKKQL